MKKSLLLAFCGAAMLAACGGGGDSAPAPAPAPTAEIPASAMASVAGWVSYMVALIASPADDLEPVGANNAIAPTDDTIEPASIN